jgi:transcriptional regulator with XRE-family HTH domain
MERKSAAPQPVHMSQATYHRTFIREWRKHRGLTLERLADRVGLTPSALSMLERGQRGYSQETLEQLAEALGTEPASLLMRNPGDPEAIWTIWEKINPAQREQAARVLEAFVSKKRSDSY